MPEMSKSDAELVYRYLRDAARSDVEYEGYSKTLDNWQATRGSDLDTLEAANEDDTRTFAWEFDFETDPAYDGDLVPITGVAGDEDEIRDLASDFAWDFLDNIRDEIRAMQEETSYSPRQFVTLVLDAAENAPEDLARREMDVSLGNYRGKKGDVNDKENEARATVDVTERIRK